jgi:hypothetical protein
MRILLDTNIAIHREASSAVKEDSLTEAVNFVYQ